MSIPTEPLGNFSNEALERRSAELVQANRRLTLLTRMATSFILAEPPRESLRSAFQAVASEIGARFYFNYELDGEASMTLTLKSSGGSDKRTRPSFAACGLEHRCADWSPKAASR